jgi:hypothetical protein
VQAKVDLKGGRGGGGGGHWDEMKS